MRGRRPSGRVGPPRRHPTPPETIRPGLGGGPSPSAGQPAHVAMARRPRTRADQDQPRTPAAGLTGPAATTRGFADRRRNRSAGILRCPVYRRRPPLRAGAVAALEPAARPRRASHTPAWPPRVPQKAAPTPDSPPRANHRRRAPTTPAAASRACWPAHPRPGSDLPGRGESVRPRRACQGSFRRRAGRSAGRNRRTGCEHGAKGTPNGWPIFVSWRRDMESPGAGARECCRQGLGLTAFLAYPRILAVAITPYRLSLSATPYRRFSSSSACYRRFSSSSARRSPAPGVPPGVKPQRPRCRRSRCP